MKAEDMGGVRTSKRRNTGVSIHGNGVDETPSQTLKSPKRQRFAVHKEDPSSLVQLPLLHSASPAGTNTTTSVSFSSPPPRDGIKVRATTTTQVIATTATITGTGTVTTTTAATFCRTDNTSAGTTTRSSRSDNDNDNTASATSNHDETAVARANSVLSSSSSLSSSSNLERSLVNLSLSQDDMEEEEEEVDQSLSIPTTDHPFVPENALLVQDDEMVGAAVEAQQQQQQTQQQHHYHSANQSSTSATKIPAFIFCFLSGLLVFMVSPSMAVGGLFQKTEAFATSTTTSDNNNIDHEGGGTTKIVLPRPSHIIPPSSRYQQQDQNSDSQTQEATTTTPTLRQFLTDPRGFHLAMAPAFFGFYGYFGSLAAWDEELSQTSSSSLEEEDDNTTTSTTTTTTTSPENNNNFRVLVDRIHGVAGASAGAMAAVLLSEAIPPRIAADFCTTVTLQRFADGPGLLAAFRGHLFERILYDFLRTQKPTSTLRLEDAVVPVAVSGFDLHTLQGKLLSHGSMARAARASATFPFLFQPIEWRNTHNHNNNSNNKKKTTTDDNDDGLLLLIDGGLADFAGLNGLGAIAPDQPNKRVVNLVVGDFLGPPPGPSQMPPGVIASEVVSISLRNLPNCGPWAMSNGPLAVEAASQVMKASLDVPLYRGVEEGHYELHLDASSFRPKTHNP